MAYRGDYGRSDNYSRDRGDNYSRGDRGGYRSNYSDQRQGGGGGYSGQRNDRTEKKGKFFVGGLPVGVTKEDLMEYFGKYGAVEDAIVIKDYDTGNSKGYGFVTFVNEDSKDMCLNDSHEMNGKMVACKECHSRNQQRQQYRRNYDGGY